MKTTLQQYAAKGWFFAPRQVGGFKSHAMDPDKLNGSHFMLKEKGDSMASKDCSMQGYEASNV